jgi:RNA polymerase sigma-70 factor, ECF subfamily
LTKQRSSASARAANRPDGVVLPLSFVGDDVALVKAIRANHPGAKAALFDRYAEHVERVVTHVLGFDAELSDVLQDVFVGAFAAIHTLEDPSVLKAWLSRVAALTARKVLRTRSRRAWLRLFTNAAQERRWEPATPGPDSEARQALGETYALLDKLAVDERLAFTLRFVDGMDLVDVAAACQVSLATIKRRLRRAEERFFCLARQRPVLAEWMQGGSRWQDP